MLPRFALAALLAAGCGVGDGITPLEPCPEQGPFAAQPMPEANEVVSAARGSGLLVAGTSRQDVWFETLAPDDRPLPEAEKIPSLKLYHDDGTHFRSVAIPLLRSNGLAGQLAADGPGSAWLVTAPTQLLHVITDGTVVDHSREVTIGLGAKHTLVVTRAAGGLFVTADSTTFPDPTPMFRWDGSAFLAVPGPAAPLAVMAVPAPLGPDAAFVRVASNDGRLVYFALYRAGVWAELASPYLNFFAVTTDGSAAWGVAYDPGIPVDLMNGSAQIAGFPPADERHLVFDLLFAPTATPPVARFVVIAQKVHDHETSSEGTSDEDLFQACATSSQSLAADGTLRTRGLVSNGAYVAAHLDDGSLILIDDDTGKPYWVAADAL